MTPNFKAFLALLALCTLCAWGVSSAASRETVSQAVYRGSTVVERPATIELCRARAAALEEIAGTTATLSCRVSYTYVRTSVTPLPPVEVWTACASEWVGDAHGSCVFTPSPSSVRFGDPVSNRWSAVRSLASPVSCDAASFGGDPAPGVEKVCETTGVPVITPPVDPPPPPPPPATGSAVLSWTPPTQNTDGTPLTNLIGYIVNYGTSCDARASATSVATSSHRIDGLAPGSYCFSVSAVNSEGAVSAPSNTATKVIQ